jgi:hypothetical protein
MAHLVGNLPSALTNDSQGQEQWKPDRRSKNRQGGPSFNRVTMDKLV